MLTIFGWNFEIWAVQKYVNLVDLVKSFLTSIYLQTSASIQPRTSRSKFGWRYSNSFSQLSPRDRLRVRAEGQHRLREPDPDLLLLLGGATWALFTGPADPWGEGRSTLTIPSYAYPALSDKFDNFLKLFANFTTISAHRHSLLFSEKYRCLTCHQNWM